MRFFKPLHFLLIILFAQPLMSQINRVGFDRYQILDQDYLVGYRSDSFFVCSNSGNLRFSGKGTPIQVINFDLLIFSRNKKKGIVQSNILGEDTMLYPPIYEEIHVEGNNLIMLTGSNGETKWLDINTREPFFNKPESGYILAKIGDRRRRQNGANSGESDPFEKNDTLRSITGDIYYRGPFALSNYAICKRGKYWGLSNYKNDSFQEILPCKFTSILTLSNENYQQYKSIIFFVPDTGFTTAIVYTKKTCNLLDSENIEIKDYYSDTKLNLVFLQKNKTAFILINNRFQPINKVFKLKSELNRDYWFFQTPRSTICPQSNAKNVQPKLVKMVLTIKNTTLFSGLKYNSTDKAQNVYYLFQNGKFSEAISNYQIKNDSAGNNYLFYNFVSTPDMLHMVMQWKTRNIANGEYIVLDNDVISRKNMDNTWDVLELKTEGYDLKNSSLPGMPSACYLCQSKINLLMGYWVKNLDNHYTLFNAIHKPIHTSVKQPEFSKINGLFSGRDSMGAFLEFGGFEGKGNAYYLHPGEFVTNYPFYAQLNYNGKLGYIGYINRLVIQPKFDEFTFQKNILIARAGQKYYFYETGIYR